MKLQFFVTIVIYSFILIVLSGCNQQAANSDVTRHGALAITNNNYVFPTRIQTDVSNEPLSHHFAITNNSTEPMSIQFMGVGCSCTSLTYQPENSSIYVDVKKDEIIDISSGKSISFVSKVRIDYTQQVKNYSIHFQSLKDKSIANKGFVVYSISRVYPRFSHTPDVIAINHKDGGNSKCSFKVTHRSIPSSLSNEPSLRVADPDILVKEKSITYLGSSVSDGLLLHDWEVSLSLSVPTGRNRSAFLFFYIGEEVTGHKVPMIITTPQSIIVTPNTVTFSYGVNDTKLKKRVRLMSTDDSSFAIQKINCNARAISVTSDKPLGTKHKSHWVTIEASSDLQQDPECEVKIYTDHAVHAAITIPIGLFVHRN